ncbi:hypothetical protein IFR05_012584 [Cadophora sp. M221]|nr:hypothetical protein IFR05_012584 [Cadophora sp. M221]
MIIYDVEARRGYSVLLDDDILTLSSLLYYANEKEVGEAICQSGMPRCDLFITTKTMTEAGQGIRETWLTALIKKLNGKDGHADLFLIYASSGGPKNRKESYPALKKLLETVESGKTNH